MEKYKTEWNLGLLYKGDNDPQIEKDMQAIEKACADFEKKYRGKDFTATPEKLLKALKDLEKTSELVGGAKPLFYSMLRFHTNTEDTVPSAMMAQFEQRIIIASNKITFFPLEIGKISKKEQGRFLAYPQLEIYKYELEQLFEQAKYQLSEEEENIASLFSQTSYTLWVTTQEKNLSRQTVSFRGKEIPLSEARGILPDLPKKDRHELYAKLMEIYKATSFLAESEINAICNYKKVLDEKRGYKNSYSSSAVGNHVNDDVVETLTSVVTKYFPISQRFYKLHAKLLKETGKLNPADLSAKIGKIKQKFDFEKAVSIVKRGFKKIDPVYVDYFEKFLHQGQIDVFPHKGKQGGAYCAKTENSPTFILLNHVNSVRSVETIAHEMGHALHYELSASQPAYYRDPVTLVAEVASIFFEQPVSDELEQVLPEKDKIISLHDRLGEVVHGIFTQIACFNFEKELHQSIRKKGQLSREEIAALMAKHLRSYRGSAVETQNDHGYFFSVWSHIRMFFYTYTYAFGYLVSRVLYEKLKQDKNFESKIRFFLSAGSSMSPKDIFKELEINIADPAFFESGLKAIEDDIKKLEKLAKKQGFI